MHCAHLSGWTNSSLLFVQDWYYFLCEVNFVDQKISTIQPKKEKEKQYEIEVLNGIGVFIGANNWFFFFWREGGWPFLPSPILLVQGKLSRTKVNLLTQQLAVWWHQLVSKVTRNANDGVMKYPKDIFTQFTFLFYFIIMIR